MMNFEPFYDPNPDFIGLQSDWFKEATTSPVKSARVVKYVGGLCIEVVDIDDKKLVYACPATFHQDPVGSYWTPDVLDIIAMRPHIGLALLRSHGVARPAHDLDYAKPVTTVVHHVSDEDIASLLISAFEGGSNYWYRIEDGGFNYDLPVVWPEIGPCWYIDRPLGGGSLTIVAIDEQTGEPDKSIGEKVLDRASITSGINVMAAKYPRHFADLINDNADSITGDVFLQCCLFGEVVFG